MSGDAPSLAPRERGEVEQPAAAGVRVRGAAAGLVDVSRAPHSVDLPVDSTSSRMSGEEGALLERARGAAASVVDPELPVLTIADLGVLRDVALENGRVVVTITPTYSGCPAMTTIALEIDTRSPAPASRAPWSAPCCIRPGRRIG